MVQNNKDTQPTAWRELSKEGEANLTKRQVRDSDVADARCIQMHHAVIDKYRAQLNGSIRSLPSARRLISDMYQLSRSNKFGVANNPEGALAIYGTSDVDEIERMLINRGLEKVARHLDDYYETFGDEALRAKNLERIDEIKEDVERLPDIVGLKELFREQIENIERLNLDQQEIIRRTREAEGETGSEEEINIDAVSKQVDKGQETRGIVKLFRKIFG
ncbi:hypothetical protein KJ673_04420 [Patescibacteria group bacterium]|nr:hypothetical protein [Patescibacteria group bacterium]